MLVRDLGSGSFLFLDSSCNWLLLLLWSNGSKLDIRRQRPHYARRFQIRRFFDRRPLRRLINRRNRPRKVDERITPVKPRDRPPNLSLIRLAAIEGPALGLRVGIAEDARVAHSLGRPEAGARLVPEGAERCAGVLERAGPHGEGTPRRGPRGHKLVRVEVLPDGPEAVDVAVMQPEDGVHGRDVER